MPAVGERNVLAGNTDIASDATSNSNLPMAEKRWPERRFLKRRHTS
jgi:hypothetical protein